MFGALWIISRKPPASHGALGILDIIGSAQVTALLETVHVMRKVLCL